MDHVGVETEKMLVFKRGGGEGFSNWVLAPGAKLDNFSF
jgi:hypothetical protein